MGLCVNEFDNELMEVGFVEITNLNVGPSQSAADKMCTDDWTKGIPTLESQIFHNGELEASFERPYDPTPKESHTNPTVTHTHVTDTDTDEEPSGNQGQNAATSSGRT
ncbi:hypothetical protein Plec18170_007974 [Paecilomyces lecythidis]